LALRVCEYCGKPFNSFGARICAECSSMLDKDYLKARKYIYRNPQDAKFAKIVENTDVSEKALNYLIKQGRIEVGDKQAGGHKCRVCGRDVQSGCLCDRCKEILQSDHLLSETGQLEDDKKQERTDVLPLSFKLN